MTKLNIATFIVLILSFRLKKHTLTLLLTLELLILLILYGTYLMSSETSFVLMIVCVGACEGAVGLGVLVGITRMKGLYA